MVALSNANPGLRIRLKYNDKVLCEIHAGEISAEIDIGRSSSCAWRVPSEDPLISSRHAVLSRQGRIVVLQDKGSKNGTWFKGKRIEERKLKAGDRFTLGHCVLTVESENAEAVVKAVAELEVLTGNQRHERKSIQADRLNIGAAPDSDLLLTDDLVSRNHAVLIRKGEDSYWLKAFNTTNGTKVNDVPLRADQERLLKNGDRIAVAHVELIFRDGSDIRDHGHALRRLVVMVVCAAVAIALYFSWQLIRGPAAAEVHRAQAFKESGDFAQARLQLDGALSRRGYQDVQINADLLRSQLSKCEASSMQWQTIQTNLQKQDWTNAASQLGTLLAMYNDNDAWGWKNGPKVRESAWQTKVWLDAYLGAGHPEALSSAALKDCGQRLAKTIKELESQSDLQALRTAVMERQKKLNQISKNYLGLDHALQQLGQPTLPSANVLQSSVAEIEQNATTSVGPVRQKAEDILPLVRQLASSYEQLLLAIKTAQGMRFTEVQALKPNLPQPEECMIDGNLFEFRRNLENSWANFKNELPVVTRLTETLADRLGSPEAESAELLYWRNGEALQKVFQCDSLAGRFPKRTRTEPQGEYDKALCVEWFYAYVDGRNDEIPDAPFESRLGATLQTMKAAKALVKFFSGSDDKRYWQDGRIKQWVDAARRLLQLRDNIASEMRQRAQRVSGREALIAGGIAWSLMDTPDKDFRKSLAGQVANLHKSVLSLNYQRDSADSTERIELRKKILNLGLPGDPVVNQMWVESNSSGIGAGNQ